MKATHQKILSERALTDTTFRRRLLRDPQAAAGELGVALSADESQAIRDCAAAIRRAGQRYDDTLKAGAARSKAKLFMVIPIFGILPPPPPKKAKKGAGTGETTSTTAAKKAPRKALKKPAKKATKKAVKKAPRTKPTA